MLTTDEAQTVMAGQIEAPSLDVGLWWESPFFGGFTWDSPLTGKVFGFIPLSKTFRNEQKMGEDKWRNGVWNLTPVLQKCLRHCGHPFFDEAGTYQINTGWNEVPTCPSPKTAEPQ